MLKLTGAVMIVGGGAVWGFLQADKLKKRSEELSKIISALRLLENDISYGKRDIKNALNSIGKIQGVKIFSDAAENMNTNGIKKAFLTALEKEGECLLGTDKEAMKILAENLGMTDSASQISSIRHAIGILEGAQDSAAAEYARSGRLYRNIGVLAGLAAVILLY